MGAVPDGRGPPRQWHGDVVPARPPSPARLYGYGPGPAADIATTLVARGEFALILAAMAAGAGVDSRLAPFIAGYVLVRAVLGPVAAGHADLLARVIPARSAPAEPWSADRAAL